MMAKAVGVGALAHIALEFVTICQRVVKGSLKLALTRHELMTC